MRKFDSIFDSRRLANRKRPIQAAHSNNRSNNWNQINCCVSGRVWGQSGFQSVSGINNRALCDFSAMTTRTAAQKWFGLWARVEKERDRVQTFQFGSPATLSVKVCHQRLAHYSIMVVISPMIVLIFESITGTHLGGDWENVFCGAHLWG